MTRRQVAEFALFATSTFSYQASRLLTGLAAAALIRPDDYGIWGAALALLAYSTYANLGVLSGANREIPIEIGRGDVVAASRLESATFGFSLLIALVVASVAIVWWLQVATATVFVLLGVAISLQQLYLFYQVSLRARLDFNSASIQLFVLAVAFPLVALPLLLRIGVEALLVAQVVAFSLGIGLPLVGSRRGLRPTIAPADVAKLARAGIPIVAAGLAFSLLVTLDRWVALWLLGPLALGQYTLASVLSSAMLLTSTVIGQQFYPRMAMAYGQTRSASIVFSMALRQAGLAMTFLLPVAVVLVVAAPVMIDAWLPSYRPAAGPLQLLAVGFVALLAGSAFGNLLIVLGAARQYLALLLVGVGVEFLAAASAATLVGNVVAVGAATAGTFVLVGLLLFVAAARRARDSP